MAESDAVVYCFARPLREWRGNSLHLLSVLVQPTCPVLTAIIGANSLGKPNIPVEPQENAIDLAPICTVKSRQLL
jgi:hypothetical protein